MPIDTFPVPQLAQNKTTDTQVAPIGRYERPDFGAQQRDLFEQDYHDALKSPAQLAAEARMRLEQIDLNDDSVPSDNGLFDNVREATDEYSDESAEQDQAAREMDKMRAEHAGFDPVEGAEYVLALSTPLLKKRAQSEGRSREDFALAA